MLKKGGDDLDRSAPLHMREMTSGSETESFDYWLDRELRRIRHALSEPVQPHLIDIIEHHRKITR